MPQYGRPSADTSNADAYTDQAGASVTLYQRLDETVEDDADFIRTVPSPSNDVYVTKLSSLVDPISSVNHIMRMATSVDVAGQEAINFTQELRQGYVNESTLGTLIASQSRNGVTTTAWTVSAYTLSAAEANAITDYANLYFRFLINKP